MLRPFGALVAASLVVSTFIAAPAALAATPQTAIANAKQASVEARALASAALGGVTIPSGSTLHAARATEAKAATATAVESLKETVSVKVGSTRYDVRAVSEGKTSAHTTVTLYLAGEAVSFAVRNGVRLTVVKHGAKTPLLQVSTSFKRYLIIARDLVANPLKATLKRYANPSSLVSTVARGLSLTSAQTQREFGAQERYAQAALDVSSTLIDAALYLAENPKATDLSAVTPTHTTAGPGGYAGSVTLTGTPAALTIVVTNTTDTTTLQLQVSSTAETVSYAVGGVTYTVTQNL